MTHPYSPGLIPAAQLLTTGTASNLGANNQPVVSFIDEQVGYIQAIFPVRDTRNYNVRVWFKNSAASTGNYVVQVSTALLQIGNDPNAALSANTAFVLPAGNHTNLQVWDRSTNQNNFVVSGVANSLFIFRLARLGTNGLDTATSAIQVLGLEIY